MQANPAFTSSILSQGELLIGNHVFVLLDEVQLRHECCCSSFFCTAFTSCASKLQTGHQPLASGHHWKPALPQCAGLFPFRLEYALHE